MNPWPQLGAFLGERRKVEVTAPPSPHARGAVTWGQLQGVWPPATGEGLLPLLQLWWLHGDYAALGPQLSWDCERRGEGPGAGGHIQRDRVTRGEGGEGIFNFSTLNRKLRDVVVSKLSLIEFNSLGQFHTVTHRAFCSQGNSQGTLQWKSTNIDTTRSIIFSRA